MVLRIVAGDTPRPNRRAIACDPAGWAVSTYDWITASSTRRSRSFSSGIAIASNVRIASRTCQPGGEAVQPEPTLRIETHKVAVNHGPARTHPTLGRSAIGDADAIAVSCPQAEIHPLGNRVLRIEHLFGLDGRGVAAKQPEPFGVRLDVPAAALPLEAVCGRANSEIGSATPVGRIVARFAARLREVRDLVVSEAARGHTLVCK